jgi:hypothetical protein
MDGTRSPLVEVGHVIRIPPAHYLYGSGPLLLRITGIGVDPARYPALEWIGIAGVEIGSDGSEGDPREVLVRVSALRNRVLPAPATPPEHDRTPPSRRDPPNISPSALMAGAPLPPGVAICLRRCGWAPPAGVDVADAAATHTAETSHPTIFNRSARVFTDDHTESEPTAREAQT